MIVYVVVNDMGYDGIEVLGVFSSKELAERNFDRLRNGFHKSWFTFKVLEFVLDG